jgi:hypothetical protein
MAHDSPRSFRGTVPLIAAALCALVAILGRDNTPARAHNFRFCFPRSKLRARPPHSALRRSAGPSALPDGVMRRAQSEFLSLGGSGMNIMEMSHVS